MQAIFDLHHDFIDLYAYHAETCGALRHWCEHLKKHVKTLNKPDQKIFFGRGDPNTQGAMYQYTKTVDKAIVDSATNGAHESILRRSIIALIYSVWEDQYRQRIAYECGFKHKNEIKSDVFHDVNRYRQAILHAGGRLIGAPKVLKFFKEGDQVLLDIDHIDELFSILIDEINRLGVVYYKQDPKLSLSAPLNASKSPKGV